MRLIASAVIVLGGVVAIAANAVVTSSGSPGNSLTHMLGLLGPGLLVVGGVLFVVEYARTWNSTDEELPLKK